MKNEVEISVLMSAYNASAYLKAAMDSILKQTFTRFEFIIVNDGSTDVTENIIRSYTDNRIVYINNGRNLGLIESLNKGLEVAKGKYIARMDADDVALPERLAEQKAVFENDPALIAIGSDYYLLSGEKLDLYANINDSDYQKTLLLFTTCFCHPTVMMKNIFKESKIRYDKAFIHTEDYRLWTELALQGEFGNMDKALLKYRSHQAQISAANRNIQLELSNKIRSDYMRQLGFSFTEEEFAVHCTIGNNEIIRSKELLISIESWLSSLIQQNAQLEKFNAPSFKRAIHKFWFDSCGNTSLGLGAFNLFSRSELSKIYPTTLKQRTRLLAKCVIRKFKF